MTFLHHSASRRAAFTLIELLIVVAIISILASIAVPNFLEAQTRARVARVKADMRTMMTAIESYHVDNNMYPTRHNLLSPNSPIPEVSRRLEQMSGITTPIAYVTTLPADIFEQHINPPNNIIDYWDSFQVANLINSLKLSGFGRHYDAGEVSWLLVSVGPDGYLGPLNDNYTGVTTPFGLRGTIFYGYDPTNGALSSGNLYGGPDGGMDRAADILYERFRAK